MDGPVNSLVFDLLGTRLYAGDSLGGLREFALDAAAAAKAAEQSKEAESAAGSLGSAVPGLAPPNPGAPQAPSEAILSAAAPSSSAAAEPSSMAATEPLLEPLGRVRVPEQRVLRALRACDDYQV